MRLSSLFRHFFCLFFFAWASTSLGDQNRGDVNCSFVWILSPSSERLSQTFLPLVKRNRFVTSRDLNEYFSILGEGFKQEVLALKPDQMWIDFGAGEGRALAQYLITRPEPAQVLGITFRHYRWFDQWRSSPPYIWKGKYFEEYQSLPRYDLGSDVFGVFSYTKTIDQFLYRVLNDLKVGGRVYISGRLWTTLVQDRHGNSYSLIRWLSRISGVRAEEDKGVLILTRLSSEQIRVPRLELIRYDDKEMPPFRLFVDPAWTESEP